MSNRLVFFDESGIMPKLKPKQFVISFGGKPKEDTRWFSASEKCKVESGLCMLEMDWPKKGDLKVIELEAYQKAIDAIKKQPCDCYQIESDHVPCPRCEALQELGIK